MSRECTLYTTTYPDVKKRVDTQWLRLVPDSVKTEREVINIYPQIRFQEFDGFGGAFTDSAGYVYSLMSNSQKQELLEAYYGKNGLGYTLGRLHFDSCDFSMEHYQAVSDKNDREMQSFSLARSERYILPMLRDAQGVFDAPIPLLGAPWSPPAFMKDTGERNKGGALLDEYRAFYADYLCRYISEMRKAGAAVVAITTQNEPNAVQAWDSCVYTPQQEKTFIRDYLHPALQKHELGDVQLFIWDHNKERVYERACQVIDSDTDNMITGIAFHWYSGDHFEALDLVQRAFPGKKLIQSEACIEYEHYSAASFLSNAQKYAHDIIGDLNNGMTAFYDWNLVLDSVGGPNHVGNYCDAPFLYHVETGVLEQRATYAYLAHFSKHIRPGSQRIAHTRCSSAVEMTAFQCPDNSIAAVLLNQTNEQLPLTLRIEGQMTAFTLPAQSIATLCISSS